MKTTSSQDLNYEDPSLKDNLLLKNRSQDLEINKNELTLFSKICFGAAAASYQMTYSAVT